ncbi:L,D-transpeptidase [Starkeya sp. 3C]|uniref:L,D-transpeptidase n=1 Tax=Ancylobacter moscoviensis TaxID=2597768 RepID=A0ABY3DN74_9HYPH|nr:L,D-transpeptidase [Ancylobacter moscoviensis]
MRGDSSLVPLRPFPRSRVLRGLCVAAFAGLALAAGGAALSPAAAQSGVYGYQSSYQLYSRAAAAGGSAWRPGSAPVYPSGTVHPSGGYGVYGNGNGRAAYGAAPPAGRTGADAGGFEAAAAAAGPARAATAGAARGATRPSAAVGRAVAPAADPEPASYADEPDDDYYDDAAPPLPVHRASVGARGVDRKFDRHTVRYTSSDPAGTVIVDTGARFLYLIQGNGTAVRYGIGVGKEGFQWSGSERISRKAEWPEWRPPSEMIDRRPDLPRVMPGGEDNPLGARALYLGNTLYRIHGSNEPDTIGQAVSSGCIRMRNQDVIDLYNRVRVGTLVRVI